MIKQMPESMLLFFNLCIVKRQRNFLPLYGQHRYINMFFEFLNFLNIEIFSLVYFFTDILMSRYAATMLAYQHGGCSYNKNKYSLIDTGRMTCIMTSVLDIKIKVLVLYGL